LALLILLPTLPLASLLLLAGLLLSAALLAALLLTALLLLAGLLVRILIHFLLPLQRWFEASLDCSRPMARTNARLLYLFRERGSFRSKTHLEPDAARRVPCNNPGGTDDGTPFTAVAAWGANSYSGADLDFRRAALIASFSGVWRRRFGTAALAAGQY
jgi:hypothetical protein